MLRKKVKQITPCRPAEGKIGGFGEVLRVAIYEVSIGDGRGTEDGVCKLCFKGAESSGSFLRVDKLWFFLSFE